MLLGFRVLRLSPAWETDPVLVLVPRAKAFQMYREDGWEELPAVQALRELDWRSRFVFSQLRHFVADSGLAPFGMRELQDDEVLDLVRRCIRNGEVLMSRQSSSKRSTSNQVLESRRLVTEIERQTRGKLPYRGRQYKLVSGGDLDTIPGRDSYQVLSQGEARRILEGLALEAGAPADLLAKARDGISKDWRPPFSEPDGLVLLRRMPVRAAASKDDGPALTPSQMKALLDAGKPVTFFARFVDELGNGLSGFAGQLAHGADVDIDMSFAGEGFAKVALRGEKQAWLTLPNDATQDLIDALKDRWQGIRGAVDEAWKAKQESLTEVQFRRGALPELQLEAETKHTFMLRPPVAMAHMHGMYFDTNKCFLLPSAVASLKRLVDLYGENPDSGLLLVGHTDTSEKAAYNETLSLERAKSMVAFLTNDVPGWLDYYGDEIAEEKRWGDLEDGDMLQALAERWQLMLGSSPVESYQTWHNRLDGADKAANWEALKVDGVIGPKTRAQMVGDYMNCQGTTLPEDVSMTAHGCGEYFPLGTEGDELDPNPQDREHHRDDRRVELFFFDKPFGILPPPPDDISKRGSEEYPEWRRRARILSLFPVGETTALEVRLLDPDGKPYHDLRFEAHAGGALLASRMIPEDGVINLRMPADAESATVSVYLSGDEPTAPSDDDSKAHLDWTFAIQAEPLTESTRDKGQRLVNLGFADDLPPGDEVTDDLRLAMVDYQSSTDEAVGPGRDDGTLLAQVVSKHDATDSSGEPAGDASSGSSSGVA